MAGVNLSTHDCDGQVVVALRGQLDMAAAASVAAALTAVAAREPQIIVDLAGLEFIDSSGVAALVRGRNLAREAGGELLLAAPQQQVLRVLTLTRLIEVFAVHANVAEAAGRSRRVPVLPQRPALASWPRAAIRSAARALAGERRQRRKQAGAAEALPPPRPAPPFHRGQRQDRLVHPRPGRRRYRSRNTNTAAPTARPARGAAVNCFACQDPRSALFVDSLQARHQTVPCPATPDAGAFSLHCRTADDAGPH
jgi:anti-sigma B factor antagonist